MASIGTNRRIFIRAGQSLSHILPTLSHQSHQLSVSRCVKLNSDPLSIQIHGFCDANQREYGACVYMRTKLGNNDYHIELLCLKSCVALLKAISLPRLSAVLLLVRLIKKIGTLFDLSGTQTFFWSDSIVLNWISSPSRKWAVFVANRIDEIQSITDPSSCVISRQRINLLTFYHAVLIRRIWQILQCGGTDLPS